MPGLQPLPKGEPDLCPRPSGMNPWTPYALVRETIHVLFAPAEDSSSTIDRCIAAFSPQLSMVQHAEAMRRDVCFSKLPIVMMLTNSNDLRDRERAISAGANGYLLKPYNPNDCLEFFLSLKGG